MDDDPDWLYDDSSCDDFLNSYPDDDEFQIRPEEFKASITTTDNCFQVLTLVAARSALVTAMTASTATRTMILLPKTVTRLEAT